MKRWLTHALGSSVVCALMLSVNAHARDFDRVINHSPSHVIRAINHLLSGSKNVHSIATDRKSGSFRFRVADYSKEALWSEHWDGIYVSILVKPAEGGKSAVHLSVDRVYPPPWDSVHSPWNCGQTFSRDKEETSFSHLFLSLLEKEFFV
jgi:hypothetical protein